MQIVSNLVRPTPPTIPIFCRIPTRMPPISAAAALPIPAAPPMPPPAVTMPPCPPRSPSYRSCASRGTSRRPYHRSPPTPPPPPPILLVIAFEPIALTRRPSRIHDESPHTYAPAYHGTARGGAHSAHYALAPALNMDMKGILPPIGVGFPATTWPLFVGTVVERVPYYILLLFPGKLSACLDGFEGKWWLLSSPMVSVHEKSRHSREEVGRA
ncbi:hypothetical protein EDB84DRAFT_1679679 [Lactarius hengduanensis]|nr:hypothetical protein EDB85DRAFT_2280164 [Lactarius pseudohatsudake]KAH9016804.1 hypothetical protein EDB84DRAFT_1679679 [Lactarius hengduanensis]